MEDLVYNFPEQLREAIEIGEKVDFSKVYHNKIHHVLICGLGGSAMGADIVRKYAFGICKVPISVNRHYTIPSYVGEDTLVILSSYSGNTEETLAAMDAAIAQKAVIVAISAGGELEKKAKEHNILHIKLPEGYPPRAALAFSTVQELYILRELKLIKKGFKKELEECILLLEETRKTFKKTTSEPAKLAKKLKNKFPVIYTSEEMEAVAIRLRQQINENAKQLCWHHIFPEMNHNELVGWAFPALIKETAVLILRSSYDHPRVQLRYDICKPIFTQYTQEIHEITAKGEGYLTQMLYLVHFSDWLSCHLAKENKVDPTPVTVINHLKNSLKP